MRYEFLKLRCIGVFRVAFLGALDALNLFNAAPSESGKYL
jgi:hypothetical protein